MSKAGKNLTKRPRKNSVPAPYSPPPSQVTASFYKGPVPPPEDLEAYSRLVPNAPERMIAMAESALAHQQALENRKQTLIEEDTREFWKENQFGQRAAMWISLSAIIATGYLGYLGLSAAASILGSATLGTLITAFLKRDRSHLYPSKPKDQKLPE